MTSFLPSLEDTLVDLLLHGDTGVLRVSEEERSWCFFVQAGVLVGVEVAPPRAELEGTELAAAAMAEVMALRTPLWEFEEGDGPATFGLYDARHALGRAVGESKSVEDLLRALEPVLDAWPELTADPFTLSEDDAVQAWLATMDGLGPGIDRIRTAPPPAATSMATLWVAWKLGDIDLHEGQIDDEDEDEDARDEVTRDELGAERAGTRWGEHPFAPTDEAIEDDGTARTAPTAQATPTPHIDPGPRIQERSSAAISAVLKDPFIAGVATARAGNAADALPLLEEAWAEDPDRPGLEEWLAYTRFTTKRDHDPDGARAALGDLRDIMYRTNTDATAPIQPWVLMARAQLERGDIVQARSVLNHVLSQDSDDPEAMDLDARLRRAESELEAARARRGRPSLLRVLGLLLGVAALAGLAVAYQLLDVEEAPLRVDHAAAYADIVALRELHEVGGDWFAVLPPGTRPEPPEAAATCRALADATLGDNDHSVTVISDLGEILAECGPRIGGG